jgi:hypothetical protein
MLVELKEVGIEWEGMARIQLAQDRVQWGFIVVELCLEQQKIELANWL